MGALRVKTGLENVSTARLSSSKQKKRIVMPWNLTAFCLERPCGSTGVVFLPSALSISVRTQNEPLKPWLGYTRSDIRNRVKPERKYLLYRLLFGVIETSQHFLRRVWKLLRRGQYRKLQTAPVPFLMEWIKGVPHAVLWTATWGLSKLTRSVSETFIKSSVFSFRPIALIWFLILCLGQGLTAFVACFSGRYYVDFIDPKHLEMIAHTLAIPSGCEFTVLSSLIQ